MFHLAKELQDRGVLARLITSYPANSVFQDGVAREYVRSLLPAEILRRVARHLPSYAMRRGAEAGINDSFDYAASFMIGECDLLVALSGFGAYTMRRAKRRDVRVVLDRGSTHIGFQRDVLIEEYAHTGMRGELPGNRAVEKELQEYDLADVITVPTNFARGTFIERGVAPEKVVCVPYGTNDDLFTPGPFHGAPGDVFRVIYAGTLSQRKGVHYLVEAFASLALTSAELVLVGEMSDDIRPLLSRYAGSFVHCPRVPQNELVRMFQTADVFAIASIEEGLATVIPQAMAAGLPIICTDRSGGDELVTNGIEGYVVPLRNPIALAERLRELYADSAKRIAMGKRARQRVEQGFTWRHYGDRIMAAYSKLVGLP